MIIKRTTVRVTVFGGKRFFVIRVEWLWEGVEWMGICMNSMRKTELEGMQESPRVSNSCVSA